MKKRIHQYEAEVNWSDEDQCYIGRCPDLFCGGCHGDDPEAVLEELRVIIEDVIEDYQREGRALPPPSCRAARLNDALEARKSLKVSQRIFAHQLGVGLGTVRNWEQGRTQPKGPAAKLIKILKHRPDILREIERV